MNSIDEIANEIRQSRRNQNVLLLDVVPLYFPVQLARKAYPEHGLFILDAYSKVFGMDRSSEEFDHCYDKYEIIVAMHEYLSESGSKIVLVLPDALKLETIDHMMIGRASVVIGTTNEQEIDPSNETLKLFDSIYRRNKPGLFERMEL